MNIYNGKGQQMKLVPIVDMLDASTCSIINTSDVSTQTTEKFYSLEEIKQYSTQNLLHQFDDNLYSHFRDVFPQLQSSVGVQQVEKYCDVFPPVEHINPDKIFNSSVKIDALLEPLDLALDNNIIAKEKIAMNITIKNILVEKMSSDWKRFARYCFTDIDSVNAIIEHINEDVKTKTKNDDENAEDNKAKMRCLLDKLYEHYPEDYKMKIKSSLKHINRIDVLKDIDKSDKYASLKAFYVKKYGKVYKPRLNLKVTSSVDILHEFVELCLVDAGDVQTDLTHSFELMELLKKQKNYKSIQYNEVFKEENDILLITGIAGIGKSWLLKKCLLDWSNNCIWKNVDFVFYFECRMLNRYQNISNIKELLEVFYKDFVKDLDIHNHNVIFMIDGLDEFKYLDDLINYNSSSQYPIVNTLAEIQNLKSVVAGRVYAIDHYQRVYRMPNDNNEKMTIQIMGFNDNGISYYIDNNVIEEKKELVKTFFKNTLIAKTMASVPFYLSRMCAIIVESKEVDFSFLTMTGLYASIFLHFLKSHITKNDLIYKIMGNENNKKYVLNICKTAYELFVENKVIFSKEEMRMIISDFDEVEDKLFGFIERIETDLGQIYQFAHLTIMEFCASVYAYNTFSGEEIVANEKLRSCLSVICGLTNKSQNSLLKFLVNLNTNKEKISISHFFNLLRERNAKYGYPRKIDNKLFIECFYESQSSFDEIKSFDDERRWTISIDDGKTSYETSCENYFVNHLIKSGRKLSLLIVDKNILSDEEKNRIMTCSTNVRFVNFYRPINIEGWKPKEKIEWLWIDTLRYLISKKEFETFLPWINVCEELRLVLRDDIDYIEDIIEWIRCSNIKKLTIRYIYRGKYFEEKWFCNLDELKNFITRKDV